MSCIHDYYCNVPQVPRAFLALQRSIDVLFNRSDKNAALRDVDELFSIVDFTRSRTRVPVLLSSVQWILGTWDLWSSLFEPWESPGGHTLCRNCNEGVEISANIITKYRGELLSRSSSKKGRRDWMSRILYTRLCYYFSFCADFRKRFHDSWMSHGFFCVWDEEVLGRKSFGNLMSED